MVVVVWVGVDVVGVVGGCEGFSLSLSLSLSLSTVVCGCGGSG